MRGVTLVSQRFSRVLAGMLALSALAGCGGTSSRASTVIRAWTAAARARGQIEPYGNILARRLRETHVSGSAKSVGAYMTCPSGSDRMAYNETITVQPSESTTVPGLGRQLTAMLRAEGWTLISVDMTKMRLPLDSPPHPLYRISQRGLRGAANILPSPNSGAEALVFMHSSCFDAGPIAPSLGHGTPPLN